MFTFSHVDVWIAFIIGALLYVLKRAWFTVRNKQTTITTFGDYFSFYAGLLVFRFAIETGLFWGAVSYPATLTWLTGLFGLSVNLTIPAALINPVTGLFVGLGIDAGLDAACAKSKWLSKEVPTVGDSSVTITKTETQTQTVSVTSEPNVKVESKGE